MASFGNSTSPSAGFAFVNSGTAAATQFTAPSTGCSVTALHGYFDGSNSGATGYLVMWDASGNVLASVNVGTLAVGSHSAGGQQWYTAPLGASVPLSPSQTVWLGFVGSSSLVFSSEAGGSSYKVAMTSPNSFTGYSSTGIGGVGAYADYTLGGMHINTGTSGSPVWVQGQVLVNTGTSGSPIWTTAANIELNTGTPGSPVWAVAT